MELGVSAGGTCSAPWSGDSTALEAQSVAVGPVAVVAVAVVAVAVIADAALVVCAGDSANLLFIISFCLFSCRGGHVG